MKNGRPRSRRPFWAAAAIAVVAAAVALALMTGRSPGRGDPEAFWSFVLGIPATLAGIIGSVTAVLSWARRQPGGAGRDPDAVAALLAEAVRTQWERAAADRWLVQAEPIPVRWARTARGLAGPVTAAVGSARFAPLPGLEAVRATALRAGGLDDLHAVYGGLGSGRLVIVGAPGSGKSGAAVLLLLAALRYRDELPEVSRPQVPVPVIFTLHGWDPAAQRAEDWLAARLRQAYPLLAGRDGASEAARLLATARVAVILDGLDEIPAELRPVALRALSEQAAFRLVVLSRSAEMAEAAQREFLHGSVALELKPVSPAAAATYLTRVQRDPAPPGWQDLTRRLRRDPDGPLAAALSSPLTLTLVRDTCHDEADVVDLLRFCDGAAEAAQIEDYLLDRVVPAAYAPRPGSPAPRYRLDTAQRALSHVADRMSQGGSRDLAWWRIPAWAPAWPRILAGSAVIGLGLAFLIVLITLIVGLAAGVGPRLPRDVLNSVLAGLAVGAVAGLAAGPGAKGGGSPARASAPRWRQLLAPPSWLTGIAVGLVTGLPLAAGIRIEQGAVAPPGQAPPPFGIVLGLLAGVLAWLAAALGSSRPPAASGPLRRRWPAPGRASVIIGLAVAGTAGLLTAFVGWLGSGHLSGAALGLFVGPIVGLIVGLVAELVSGLSRPSADDLDPLSPLAAWRRDRSARLTAGFIVALLMGLGLAVAYAALYWSAEDPGQPAHHLLDAVTGLIFGLIFGLVFGAIIALGQSQVWPATLAFAQLARRGHTPFRLMRFLDDAHDRHVLREVGTVYQFRHARLQDRLAAAAARTQPVARPGPGPAPVPDLSPDLSPGSELLPGSP
jgi:hypothetical protein